MRPTLQAQGGWLAHVSSIPLGDEDASVSHGPTYAVALGLEIEERLQILARWQQVFARLRGEDQALNGRVDMRSLTLSPRVALRPRDALVRPWIEGGIGWYRGSGAVKAAEPQSSTMPKGTTWSLDTTRDGLGLAVGGGIDLRLTRIVTLVVELRYQRAGEFGALTPLFGFQLEPPAD